MSAGGLGGPECVCAPGTSGSELSFRERHRACPLFSLILLVCLLLQTLLTGSAQARYTTLLHTRQFTNDPRVPGGVTYGFEEQSMNGQRLLVHLGGLAGFFSLLALLPEQRVGIFVSYNSISGGAGYPSLPFLQAFLNHYFPVPEEPLPPPPAGFAERISQISGTYWPTGRSYTTLEKLLSFESGGTGGISVADGGKVAW